MNLFFIRIVSLRLVLRWWKSTNTFFPDRIDCVLFMAQVWSPFLKRGIFTTLSVSRKGVTIKNVKKANCVPSGIMSLPLITMEYLYLSDLLEKWFDV